MNDKIFELENMQREAVIDILGLQYAVDESVPQLIGSLVLHLARKGVLNLEEYERDLRSDYDADLQNEDSTGHILSKLAELISCYRRDKSETARYSPIYELIIPKE